ncbi:MAG: YihA family ribosome biogenesis GTP-binding protein [Gammaproteobacteria bacterium]|nr:YihA family ribosome biogenesis GTP-binding protein [Gammaproteobacteria bacterium]
MNPIYHRASFLCSAARLSQAPPDEGREIAFAGRSNAGKSSAINALCQQNGLARISKTPGRTQLLNFFRLEDQRRLVDLPGYGYAKVPERIRLQWRQEISSYLEKRRSLAGIMLVMDIRHPFTDYDEQVLAWGLNIGVPLHILLTKADKMSRGAAGNVLLQARRRLTGHLSPASTQLFSATRRQGIDEAHAILDRWLETACLEPAATSH